MLMNNLLLDMIFQLVFIVQINKGEGVKVGNNPHTASPDNLRFLQVRHIVPEHLCISICEAFIGHFVKNGLQ